MGTTCSISNSKNYHLNYFLYSGLIVGGLIINQLMHPTHLYINIFLCLLLNSFFLFRKEVLSIRVIDDKVFLEYFQCFKKKRLEDLRFNVKIEKMYQSSYRSPSKKIGLSILIQNKKFVINKLDGFEEDKLLEFHKSFISNK